MPGLLQMKQQRGRIHAAGEEDDDFVHGQLANRLTKSDSPAIVAKCKRKIPKFEVSNGKSFSGGATPSRISLVLFLEPPTSPKD
jgi:hypothetical protein